jgi:putative Ca2+/H+ antiporter (TMEM165/GDT1 family)
VGTGRRGGNLETFLLSTGVVALAEIGDKTQLLALVLATRFRRWLPISAGILIATLANHALAAAVGTWAADRLGPDALRWTIGLSFLAMAAWSLIPDKLDEPRREPSRAGVFITTLVAFFLVEMGDKTQLATIALAAQSGSYVPVLAGTTLGMMVADVPAVVLGQRFAHRLPVRVAHVATAIVFAVLGVLVLLGVGS